MDVRLQLQHSVRRLLVHLHEHGEGRRAAHARLVGDLDLDGDMMDGAETMVVPDPPKQRNGETDIFDTDDMEDFKMARALLLLTCFTGAAIADISPQQRQGPTGMPVTVFHPSTYFSRVSCTVSLMPSLRLTRMAILQPIKYALALVTVGSITMPL